MRGGGSGLDETKYTLTEHLTELRSRLLKSIGGILLTTLGCAFFAPAILDYAVEPLVAVLAERGRVEALLVHPSDGSSVEAIEERLSSNRKVRYRGRARTLPGAGERIRSAAGSRRPIDLVLVSTAALGADGLLVADLVEGIEPTPYVAYLVRNPRDPMVVDLQLEGALVILDPPRPAVLERVVRRAAAAAGKAQSGDKLVVLSPLEPFFAYLKIALVCGLFLACPIWIYQAWAFVAPGLYAHEKRLVVPVVVSGSALFVGGGLFAYYVMFPLMFDVLVNQMMPDSLVGSFTVDKYLGLLLRVTVAFGVVFELPLAIAILAALGVVDANRLRRLRKYAFVAAFIIGAILTPADPLSQMMMALPLIVFYEIGILLAGMFARRRAEAEAAVTSLATVDDPKESPPGGAGPEG